MDKIDAQNELRLDKTRALRARSVCPSCGSRHCECHNYTDYNGWWFLCRECGNAWDLEDDL